MQEAVRCPYCDELSRVPAAAIGQYVSCPNCRRPFAAVAEELPPDPPARRPVPTVYPAKKPVPVVHPAPGWDEYDVSEPAPHKGPRSVLYGLALLPFVIPLLWELGPVVAGKEAIFTRALPMAIAVSSAGLCLGVVLAADWSFATRVKAIVSIVFVMHFLAAFLYFLKPEWVEVLRRQVAKGRDQGWQTFTPPDHKYTVRVPGDLHADDRPLLKEWTLTGYRSDGQDMQAAYFVAYGRQPKELDNQPEEKFFEAAKKAAEAGGTVTAEKDVRLAGGPGREFVLALPDKHTRRVVRVYRHGQSAFVAAVEDAFLTPDARDVKYFFDHLELKSK